MRLLGTVYLHAPLGTGELHRVRNAAGLRVLEADLAVRGHVLAADLRAALGRLDPRDLALHGIRLLGRVEALLGADQPHQPLFRDFPDSVPSFAQALYSGRILAFLLAQPLQPCLLCGTAGRVGALAACGHLLCPDCLDRRTAADAEPGCPLCGEPYPRAQPYAEPTREAARPWVTQVVPGGTLRPLRLGGGPAEQAADAEALVLRLLARATPLNPQDRADLAGLLPFAQGSPADWLPERIPVRETKATVLAALLRAGATRAATLELLPERLSTATDVLRLLWAWSGAEPDLLAPPRRLAAVPRPVRRALLARLDAFEPAVLLEDLGRHRQAWLRAGELLHPGEFRARHGGVALAFDALRADRPGDGLPRTLASRVEEALRAGDTAAATALLLSRPGELVRRLHQLLRVQTDRQLPGLPVGLAEGLPGALRSVGPGPLLGAYGRLRAPRTAGERRSYFPRARITKVFGRNDWGTPVPAALGDPVCALIEAELLRRSAQLPPVEVAVIDRGLADLTVPFAERALSKALVVLPRGSVQPVPAGARVRLFVHWVEPDGVRVDLDLSVAFFSADWEPVGQCDYTQLTWGERAAVHSGDYTSAPAPDGATEFVDLDLAGLAAAGVRYALPVVFSYNDIPFEDLPKAFAGFMALDALDGPTPSGAPYHPGAVRQRFDLAGEARACLPMVVDLAQGRAHWTDVNLSASGGLHNVDRHADRLGLVASDLLAHFGGGGRASLWDLARWRAAGTAREVLVRDRDGAVSAFRRTDEESVMDFAERLDGTSGLAPEELGERSAFLALVHGDLPARAATGGVYRLYPGPVDESAGLTRLAAADLLAALEAGR
ncbi:MXAN_6230/SCO0854 family RING domain-containing protein [Kitasatospora viridis]|uniref:MXAN_6230/SCO0854 family RING domain-containing protein n=1 Tax=Kitasatospora viridis TaxID=281105 RepID=UPI00319E7469